MQRFYHTARSATQVDIADDGMIPDLDACKPSKDPKIRYCSMVCIFRGKLDAQLPMGNVLGREDDQSTTFNSLWKVELTFI
jgi:hypothetical protein